MLFIGKFLSHRGLPLGLSKEFCSNAGDLEQGPGQEDLLRSVEQQPTWRIPWTEEAGRLSPLGHKESDTTERQYLWN